MIVMNYKNENFIKAFINIIKENNPDKIFFVCSSEYDRYGYRAALDAMGIQVVAFSDFEPCPEVSSVKKAVEIFRNEKCDFIIAVGGGSAIDAAKAVKLFSEADVKILAVPTTAGTGAEVTRFAVLYNNGDKDSVRSYNIIPEFQVFDYTTLKSLPYNQRVVTALDSFCHAFEAYWSKDCNEESKEYSKEALKLFNNNFNKYLKGDDSSFKPMMRCSELAGRAINIAQTTAAHAFSYKLHKLKGFYHGQAVAVSLAYIWRYMAENCKEEDVVLILNELEQISGYNPESFITMLDDLNLLNDLTVDDGEFDEIIHGVNISRLSNHPVSFTDKDIENIYNSFLIVC